MRINGTRFVATSGYAIRMFTDRKYPKYARKIIQHKIDNHEHMALLLTIDNEDYHCELEYIHDLFEESESHLWSSVKRFYYNKENLMQNYHVNIEVYYDKIILKSGIHDTKKFGASSSYEFMIEFNKFTDSLMQAILAEIKKISKHED